MNWEARGIELLAASIVRPFALVAAAWVILRLFRVRHPASRHAVWSSVLVGMLLLPFVSVLTPHWMVPVLPSKRAAIVRTVTSGPGDVTIAYDSFTPQSAAAAKSATGFEWPAVQTLVVGCYFAGLFAMVCYRLAGWVMLRRVISRSRRFRGRLLESNDVLTPVAVGLLHAVVVLPVGWRAWSAGTRRAILAHEFAHLRRHDMVVGAASRWIMCVLWFHPLAWWVSRTISELAELACDATALERVGDPVGYSRMLLEFSEAVNHAGRRVALPGLAMAAGSGMGRRIDGVFELSGGNMRKLARPGVLLVLTGVPVICLAATVGLGLSGGQPPRFSAAPASRILAQSPVPVFDAPPVKAPQIIAQQSVTPRVPAPSVPTTAPRFDAVSIRLNKDCGEGPGRGGGAPARSPGRLRIGCISVQALIEGAYAVTDVNGRRPPRGASIEGGPAWTESDLYAIEAETDGTPGEDLMRGPMMQALLENRFRLKIHRETREIPVYVLTVAKGGPRLQPFQEGNCTEHVPGSARPGPGEKPWCGTGGMRIVRNGRHVTWDETGASFLNFSVFFGIVLDRPLIDRTGITGTFDFHLEFAPDETTSGVASPFAPDSSLSGAPSDPAGGPSIFTVFQEQLGLKLESGKGPSEVLVIDHIERPSEN